MRSIKYLIFFMVLALFSCSNNNDHNFVISRNDPLNQFKGQQFSTHISNSQLNALIELIYKLDTTPPKSISCPVDLGIEYVIHSKSEILNDVTLRPTGCRNVEIEGKKYWIQHEVGEELVTTFKKLTGLSDEEIGSIREL